MRKTIYYITYVLILLSNNIYPADNRLIAGVSVNHTFNRSIMNGSNAAGYSLSVMYTHSLNNYFDIGLKGVIDNFSISEESSALDQNLQIPLLLVLHYYIIPENIYTAIGAGVVLNPGEEFSSEEIFTGKSNGLALEIASGYNFDFWEIVGGNIELGLTYKKFGKNVYQYENSVISAIVRVAFLLDI